MPIKQDDKLYVIIMAGGKGTRFWPLSRSKRPKQLLPIIGRSSLLEQAVERLAPLVGPEQILISTGKAHYPAIHKLLPGVPKDNYIIEPAGRDTAPAIGLSLMVARHRLGKDAVVAILPSDHHISETERFLSTLSRAAKAARKENIIYTLGIKPTFPSTAYGYIIKGKPLTGPRGTCKVKAYIEKPDLGRATELVRGNDALWNAGMFVMRVSVALNAYKKYLPKTYAGLQKIGKALGTPEQKPIIEEVFPKLRRISIDYGIMEKAHNLAVIPGSFGWSDLGGWQALYRAQGGGRGKNVSRGGHVALDSKGCLIESDKLVATVGVDDLVVVETKDAILIIPRKREGEVKAVVELLKKQGLKEYL